MIGCYNKYENAYEFCRRFQHSGNTIEESVTKNDKLICIEYDLRPFSRSILCKQQLANLHRRSVNFINNFVSLEYIYQIKVLLSKVNLLTQKLVTNKYAQVQLENSKVQQ
jgi:hypothetical protein